MSYKQLTYEERYQISRLMDRGYSLKDIAKILGRHYSTIYRELSRNKHEKGYYSFVFADEKAKARHKVNQYNARRLSAEVWLKVESLLEQDWSPEQIKHFTGVSHEQIYVHIYKDKCQGGQLYHHLRHRRKKRKTQRRGGRKLRGVFEGAVSIDERPAIVDERSRIGDFEIDTVIGARGGSVLVTAVERQSGLLFISKSLDKTRANVCTALIELLMPVKDRVKTITADNGREFSFHGKVAKALACDFYFAHPHSPWERGCNENANGLIRQYFPKRMSFTKVTKSDILAVMHRLNTRPRKRLAFKTPYEVFYKQDFALRC